MDSLVLHAFTNMLVVGNSHFDNGVICSGYLDRQCYGKYWGEDPRAVVIDEFFGTWIAVMSATLISEPDYLVIALAVIAFGLFRIIDILKPLGCRWIDNNIT